MRRLSTFVSSHVRPGETEVLDYVKTRLNVRWRASASNSEVIEVETCPSSSLCAVPDKYERRREPGNQWKLSIWRKTGTYHCFRCQGKGSWYDLRYKVSGLKVRGVREERIAEADQKQTKRYAKALFRPEGAGVRALLESRGLDIRTAAQFGVGATVAKFADDDRWNEHQCVTFPWIDEDKTVRVKLRSVKEKRHMRLEPRNGGSGLFGMHTVKAGEEEVVLTEGEFDALAVAQATGRPCVSVPHGASQLPPAVLPLLERFKTIYLWMDNDVSGQNGAKKFADKLGLHRCWFVHTEFKDANEALQQGADLEDAILNAVRPRHDAVVTFADLRDQVIHEFKNPDLYNGVPLPSLPQFTKLALGVRPGELSLLTGTTGSGKTTIASQLTMDLAEQRAPILWGSFEVRHTQLALKMLQQFERKPLRNETLESAANGFELLPVYFLTYEGNTDVDAVIDAMFFARYAHDVEHVVLDNLQFMTGATHGRSSFEAQDAAVAKLRNFATANNVHVLLVVHPRKEDPKDLLTMESIYGGAKAIQEADNVYILQKPDPNKDHSFKSLQIAKNRYGGALGTVRLFFSRDSLRYYELANPPQEEEDHEVAA